MRHVFLVPTTLPREGRSTSFGLFPYPCAITFLLTGANLFQ